MYAPPRFPSKHRFVLAATLMAALVVPGASSAGSAAGVDNGLKLAFLYNFSKFVRWPEHALPVDAERFVLCVHGDPYLLADMRAALGTKQAQGRAITLVDTARGDDPRGCHILFVTEPSEESAGQLLGRVRDAAVLTVGENETFTDRGIIGLYSDGQRLRFAVNLGAAGRAGLELNARLLDLAKVVSDE